jgi:hypothetical protein
MWAAVEKGRCAATQTGHTPIDFCWYKKSTVTGWLHVSGTGWLQVLGIDLYRFTMVYLTVTV